MTTGPLAQEKPEINFSTTVERACTRLRDEALAFPHLFTGGLTAARGQVGTNCASDAIIDHFSGTLAGRDDASVFGCPIRDPSITELGASL